MEKKSEIGSRSGLKKSNKKASNTASNGNTKMNTTLYNEQVLVFDIIEKASFVFEQKRHFSHACSKISICSTPMMYRAHVLNSKF